MAVLQCGAMRLRPLTEAECYARCYGGFHTDQVSILLPGGDQERGERVAGARPREIAESRERSRQQEAA